MKTATAEKLEYPSTLSDFYTNAQMGEVPAWAYDIPVVLPDGEVPSKFQISNLNRILTNSYWGFFDDPGTGKTLPAQAYSMYMALNGYRSLLVMPPVLREQYVRSLTTTYPGVENLLTWHIFDEDPYPVKISKKKVQDIKKALWNGDKIPKEVPKSVIDLIKKLRKATPIYFTEEEIRRIRTGEESRQDLAAYYYCSENAISQLRKKTFRQDLVKKWRAEDSWPDLLLMSYQMFIKEMANVEEAYACLMADEAHALCHPSSSSHKTVHAFLRRRDRTFLPMTGTPAPNVPTDTYGLIKLLNPSAYRNYAEFRHMHVDEYAVETRQGQRFMVVNGYRNLDLMSRSLYAHGSRVTKDQVLTLDKPRIIEEEIGLSPQHQKLYETLVKERLLEGDTEFYTASEVQTLRQMALQIVINPEKYTSKQISDNTIKEWLIEKLDSIGCEHLNKVVVFAQFNASVQKIAQWFEHLNPALVYGKSDTQKNVQKFLTDDTCRLMIAHPKSGGVGVDKLQTLCHHVIFVEPTSVPGDFTQALDRLVRRGQKHPVLCYILRVVKTTWPKRVDEMRRKMKLISDVTMDRTALLNELLGK